MTNPFAEVRQAVRATRCNVPGKRGGRRKGSRIIVPSCNAWRMVVESMEDNMNHVVSPFLEEIIQYIDATLPLRL
jgi:hypothetical protein